MNGISQVQQVARSLRDAITAGRIRPGSRIPQQTIARELGVSRSPVREALRQLESEGLVVIRPNSGARVSVLEFEQCIEIYKIRERLEPLALSESIGNLTAEQVETAGSLARELELVVGDRDAWLTGDRRFHLATYAGLRDGALLRMTAGFWNTTQHYRRALLTTFSADDFEVAHAEHLLLVRALATGNQRSGAAILRIAIERSRLRLTEHRDLFEDSR